MTEPRAYVFAFLLPDGSWRPVLDDSGRIVSTAVWQVAYAFTELLGSRSPHPVVLHHIDMLGLARMVMATTTTWHDDPRWAYGLIERQATDDRDVAAWTDELAQRVPLPVETAA